MMLTTIVDALVQTGATPEMILAAVNAFELEREKCIQAKRGKDAERQRRHRLSRDVTVTDVTSVTTSSPLVPPSDGFPHPSLTPPLNPPISPIITREALVLPDWMPIPEWEAFKEMRKKIKKPMTAHAERLAVGKLERFRAKGHDPTVILNQSILSDYQDLYEPKETRHAAHISNPQPTQSKWVTAAEQYIAKHAQPTG